MEKVIVTANHQGSVITVSENNPEYGFIRLEQTVVKFNNSGWLRSGKISTLIHGRVEDLEKANYKAGTELPGKIVILENLTPFNAENPEKNLKIAGNSGVICRFDDQPIYRQTQYTLDESATDQLIQHTNTEEIKNTSLAIKELNSLNINTDLSSLNF